MADPVVIGRVLPVVEVRLLFLAAGVSSGLVAAALVLARDGEALGRVLGAVLLGAGAAGSLVCAAVCSQGAFKVSLLGLTVGYVERALAVPWAVLVAGSLEVDPWRAAIAVAVYTSLAVLVGVVWLRVLLPVLVFTCEWPNGRAHESASAAHVRRR